MISLRRMELSLRLHKIRRKQGFFAETGDVTFLFKNHYLIPYDDFISAFSKTSMYKNIDKENRENELRYLYLVLTSMAYPSFEESKKIIMFFEQIPDTVLAMMNYLRENLPFELTAEDVNYLVVNLYQIHTLGLKLKGDSRVYGWKRFYRNYKNLYQKESKWLVGILKRAIAENPEISAMNENYPPFEYQHVLLLLNVLVRHRKPIRVLLLTTSQFVEADFIVTSIQSVPHVETIIETKYDPKNPPDAILSNWFKDEKYGDIPFFQYSNILHGPFMRELRYFLSGLADKKFDELK
jgi:hypothetical protein